MKDAVILLLCAVALAQGFNQNPDVTRTCNCDPSEAQQICQANYDSDDVLIAHENCNQFYKCANGKPVAYYCPNNLLYDPLAETCEWPHSVDCGDRPISEGPGNGGGGNDDVSDVDNDWTCNCNPGEAPSICAAEGSNGILVAHQHCNQFYKCAESRPVTFDCPPTLLYNPYKEECDWPQNVECGDRVIPDPKEDDSSADNDSIENDGTCNCNPEEAPAICAAPDSESVLVAHENCNQYYICNHGIPVALSCFGDLLFNPYTKECDWPRNVECGDRLVPENECTGCNENNSDDTSCDDDDVSPAPPGNESIPEDSDSSDIGLPGDVVPVPTRPPGTCNCNPEEAPSICAAEDSSGVLVAHDNCNQFYKCDHGKPVVLTCHGDLLYNPYTEQCDWPENVDCGDRVIPGPDDSVPTPGVTNQPGSTPGESIPGNNCDPSEAPAICAADDAEGVLVAHENCNQFYVCSGGKPVALTCPPNLLFNPAKDQCDWPENVDCGDRVIPDPDDSASTPGVTNPGVTNQPGSTPGESTPGNNCDPSEAPAICAADDAEGVLVAHENCNQFYVCSGGKPVALTCPPNLLFNPAKDQCDWPENVDCGERVIPDPESADSDSSDIGLPGDVVPVPTRPPGTCNCNPEEAPSICAAEDSSGVLVAHENCNQFYKCDHGKPVVLTCHGDLLYNPYTEQCDWPENVDCGDRVIPGPDDSVPTPGVTNQPGSTPGESTPGNNCDPSEAPAICAADDAEGVLVAHENCNQFYVCSGGKPVALTCPPNLLFNPAKDQCDWPENVDCGDRVIPDPDDSASTPGVTNPGVTNPGVTNQPGPTPGESTPGNNCDPSEAPAICAADDAEGVLVAHENCNQFYVCSGGKPVALTCPSNLLFNPAKDQCDWPENVDCGERVIPDPESADSDSSDIGLPGDVVPVPTQPPGTCNCNPEEAPSICAAEDSSGVLVAHENCNQFYKCDHGKPVVLTCHGDLLYNPYTEQCDWPENVDCGDRVIPGPDDSVPTPGVTNQPGSTPGESIPGNNCDPSEAPAICAADDAEGVLVAHENCNQFYVCSGGKPVALTCPPNLLFNPAKDQCDWPENVDCGDRVIPDPDDSASTPGVTNPGVTNPGVTNQPGPTPGESTPGNNCDPSEAPAICAADDAEGVLVAHENCNQFYVCSGGKPVALTCPSNLLFNPAKDQCDWPENVDCGERVIPDPESADSDSSDIGLPGDVVPVPTRPPGTCNCNPEEAPSICAAEDSSGVLVAHDNCNQFYKCDHGKPVVLTCHGDLLYNPYTEQCDWPENVDCGDRVIPGPDDSVPTPGVTNQPGSTPGESTPGNNCDPNEAPAICAADDAEGVLVAHENCNQFYVCSGGKPVALTCPPNLLFNPAKDQCDWPENVDCGDRVIPDPDDSASTPGVTNPGVTNQPGPTPGESVPGNNCDPSEAPAICAADDAEGVLVAHENCNQFYVCSGGKPVALTCPPNLLFNPAKDQCDWPENVDCGERVIPDPESADSDSSDIGLPGDVVPVPTRPPGTCNCNPEEAPSICAAEDSSGVLVAHENCNQFYKCDHGKPVVLTCHGDLLYNPYTEQCDWPENVDCGDRVIPGPNDSVPTPGVTNQPGSTPGESIPGNNCDPSEAPAICAADDAEGVLVAHENCNQFYVCSGGKPVALTCPPNLLFNPAKDQCDWPENVDCGDRVIPHPDDSTSTPGVTNPGVTDPGVTNPGVTNQPSPTPGESTPGNNCDPSEAPAICAADDSDGVMVAHENCNQFFICFGGIPIALTCPSNLLYNPAIEQCDWPHNVDCGDRVTPGPDDSMSTPGVTNSPGTTPGVSIPGNNCDPSEAPAICAADNSEGVLVAHENCNQFYKCSEGKPVALTCPPNLLFNPNKDQCDWPENVDCGDRVMSEDSESSEISLPGDAVPTQPPVEDSNETTDCSEISDENGDQCNCNPEQAPSICAVNNSDGVLIAHENCNQFYKCDNGKPVPFRCPSNTLYNPVAQACDWAFNVDCGDRVIPNPEDNISESEEDESEEDDIVGPCNCNPGEAPAICAADGSSGVQIAHENCNQFYMCDHGRPVAFTCHGLLLYNPYTQTCDWPPNVVCGDRVIPEPESDSDENGGGPEDNNSNNGNDDPSQAPTICAGDGSDGVLVAHENCDQYYICAGGVPVSRPCNPGLLFNPNNQQCDWPNNVNCGDRIVPDDCACNPRNAPALCAKPGSEGKLIAHENCSQFYICSHSIPVAQTCPAGLFYNSDNEWCDWPQNVNCGDRLRSFSSHNKHSRQTLRN